jgi:uncharacterized protein YndB with AHSA1/START domain
MDVETHEQLIEAPPADVWRFMVDPAALSVWFGADAWLDPTEGGAVRFGFADGSVRRGEIETVDAGRALTWRWREHHGAGFGAAIGAASTVSIELEAVPGGTLVRIVERPAAVATAGDGDGSR